MPEGDNVFRTAKRQHAALAGKVLDATDFRVPTLATVDLSGQRLHEVTSYGKHLFHRIGDWNLHSHLRMEGAWVEVWPGERWPRQAYRARVVLRAASVAGVGFDLAEVSLMTDAEADALRDRLGPDLLGEWTDADVELALQRLEAHSDTPIFTAMLDQTVVAGAGNVYANELCFLLGVAPTRPAGEVDGRRALDLVHRMLVANRDRDARSTTGDLRRGKRTWVYGRAGQACRRCGTLLQGASLGARAGEERSVTWCPHCQR